ncbi:hypothetical protein [Ornithinicoccus halotolerans]|uniref:hypothetical protein n=1 Tax=Ornithinicoccus halotolerans TaxID=1748220 RepID=UPI001885EC43|nr:hypothetical protein [Ornithinicoccus halotolerans]
MVKAQDVPELMAHSAVVVRREDDRVSSPAAPLDRVTAVHDHEDVVEVFPAQSPLEKRCRHSRVYQP